MNLVIGSIITTDRGIRMVVYDFGEKNGERVVDGRCANGETKWCYEFQIRKVEVAVPVNCAR